MFHIHHVYLIFFFPSANSRPISGEEQDAFLSLPPPPPLSLFFCLFQHSVPYLLRYAEVAGGFTCPAAGEVSGASGSFSRHAHPEDCRKYYICLEGIAREYGCPIGTVFKIGDADGSGACEDPEDVPGW